VQALLQQRGIQVSHEPLRAWCTKSGPLFAEDLRFEFADACLETLTVGTGDFADVLL
jgi:hypothetical protein